MKEKIIYYDDEKNNEFSGITKNTVSVDKSFRYIKKGFFHSALTFIVYRIIMTPIAYLWSKLKFGLKVKNKKVLSQHRKEGYFIFSNHTLMAGDAFIPNVYAFPKKVYMVVHPDNISTKGTKGFIMMCGAIPTPTSIDGYRGFLSAVEQRIREGGAVCVYPEAHIWPYYTKIRDFSDTSFAYPVKLDAPVFSATVTYTKRRLRKTPKATVYIDGPFYPCKELKPREAQKELRNRVYSTMVDRSNHSTYERIKYVKRETEADERSNHDTDNIRR
ncbi:MAG: 1-acyl-sn-glycerol-3-phosphate acyltransferase [Clostridia bacterium]|nr:1-acyl-sn-glycerol-3-phosphate acyltransferase [Clostridia bacterium]